jgi:hypothetical protein
VSWKSTLFTVQQKGDGETDEEVDATGGSGAGSMVVFFEDKHYERKIAGLGKRNILTCLLRRVSRRVLVIKRPHPSVWVIWDIWIASDTLHKPALL